MPLPPNDLFASRHLGPRASEIHEMLATLGYESLDALLDAAVPRENRTSRPLDFPALSEQGALDVLEDMAGQNRVYRSYIGLGYHATITPGVILRNILENPGWYTAYTPYQAEIAQGRLEALINYQTVVADLTGLEIANASLLDEATAAAEAMAMSHRLSDGKVHTYFVSDACHPQTIAVVLTRAAPLGIEVVVGDAASWDWSRPVFGALLQYPASDGAVVDWSGFCAAAKQRGALVTVATDLLALCLLRPPGEFGADIAIGSAQRFGVPMGYGGPHAAFMATRDGCKRQMPGRIIGISRDPQGDRAFRMSLQTREQHIRRERATSNICTAQVLLAVVSAMYAVYHGPDGLRRIAGRVHGLASALASGLRQSGFSVAHETFFDTVRVEVGSRQQAILAAARQRGINLRALGSDAVIVALDEETGERDVQDLLDSFGAKGSAEALAASAEGVISGVHARASDFLRAPVFHRYRSEHELLRYLHRLESKDLSLTTSMIPLGSCTMKLNATSEMIPITWPGFGQLHPFAPLEQAQGYQRLFRTLSARICEITGFDAVSLQPNAGSQGEYAGLLTIRGYQESRGQTGRNVCLIPTSAHGTNPASAVMAGMEVVTVACDDHGNIDVSDLRAKAAQHEDRLAALMVTYPSTHGVFEATISEVCAVVHQHGGQVYMDGANLNALVGLCKPAELGADVCHLNLHKTFCIPHGGGGPGMGPIAVRGHLAAFLPGHPVVPLGGSQASGAVSAAPWGSASILPISWAYIAMMGGEGLKLATAVAILNANYVAARVGHAFPVLYTGQNGRVAHECILDLRPLKVHGIEPDDVAKRLMDYGFHAPTMSFPVAGTLMVEPTESESKAELDRFCEALLSIHAEIMDVVEGRADRKNNVLHGAPHTAHVVTADTWDRPYTRQQAAFPASWLRRHKHWPAVGRVDNVWGDRNLRATWGADEEPG